MKNDEYKPKPRKKNQFVSVVLSEKDEFVPKTHIGMYTIFRNPKNKSVYMGEEHCQKLRKDTFDDILKIFKKYGSPSFADLFNYNSKVIADVGMNHFLFHPKIAPVAEMIECFEVLYKEKRNFRNLSISFGISKKALCEYFETGKITKIKMNRAKSRETVLFGKEDFEIDKDINVRIERNAIYWRFVNWCDINGVPETEGLLMALESLVKEYPTEGIKSLEEYDFLTEFDNHLFDAPENNGPKERTVIYSGSSVSLADKIIERWNRDPNNLTKKKMDFSTYCNNALYMLNNKMPIKYSSPDIWMDEIRTKEFEAYASDVMKQDKKKEDDIIE